ncbi:MAG: DUF4348 domain-containing protein, partial [Paraprevotella sp.]|nr:DUF4348 domain-containing protein [Paraprevotella sp.]
SHVSMRKNVVWGLLLTVALSACDRKKTASSVDYSEDSVFDSLFVSPDSQSVDSEPSADEGFPKKVDDIFDDFIFEFSRLKKLQYERVKFPLPVVDHGDTTWITAKQWTYEKVFSHQDYYTLLFNDEELMELEKRTDLKQVDVEPIHLDERTFRICRFERLKGEWLLTQESNHTFAETPLADFLDFYNRFVTDDVFQKDHVDDPLKFVTTDPDDDFNVVEENLSHEQWEAFKPQLPSGVITNIHYGQTYNNPNRVVLIKSGISNGMMDILTFRKADGQWKLVTYEN